MSKFSELGRQATIISRILENREKVDTNEMISRFPDGFTIVDFEFISSTDKKGNPVTYPVIAVKEDNKIAFFGGIILSKVLQAWIDAYKGDYEKCVANLQADGCKVKLTKGVTRDGNNITNVEFID